MAYSRQLGVSMEGPGGKPPGPSCFQCMNYLEAAINRIVAFRTGEVLES